MSGQQHFQAATLWMGYAVQEEMLEGLTPLQELLCQELEKIKHERQLFLAKQVGSLDIEKLELIEAHLISLLKQLFPEQKQFTLNVITRPL